MKVTTPLRYPGGKSKHLNFLSSFLKRGIDTFYEPFCGGASMSIFVSRSRVSNRVVASDLNEDVINFWNCLKSRGDELHSEVLKLKRRYENNGRELFSLIKERRNYCRDILSRSVDFFILSRCTFSGLIDAGGYSENNFRNRFTISSIDRLLDYSSIIKDIEFVHSDYESILNDVSSNDFIYFDPPYYNKTDSKLYGKNGVFHTEFSHSRFKDFVDCLNDRCLDFMVSYDNSEFINSLYDGYKKIYWSIKYSINKHKNESKNELLVLSNTLFRCTV